MKIDVGRVARKTARPGCMEGACWWEFNLSSIACPASGAITVPESNAPEAADENEP